MHSRNVKSMIEEESQRVPSPSLFSRTSSHISGPLCPGILKYLYLAVCVPKGAPEYFFSAMSRATQGSVREQTWVLEVAIEITVYSPCTETNVMVCTY